MKRLLFVIIVGLLLLVCACKEHYPKGSYYVDVVQRVKIASVTRNTYWVRTHVFIKDRGDADFCFLEKGFSHYGVAADEVPDEKRRQLKEAKDLTPKIFEALKGFKPLKDVERW